MTETRLHDARASRPETPAPAPRPPQHHPWLRFAGRRALGLIATVAALIVITFLIVPLIPGDPAVAAAGPDANAAKIESLRREMGLDLPLWQQFLNYLQSLADGTMGYSFSSRSAVSEIVFARMPYTAALAGIAVVIVLLVSIPIGVWVAVATRGSRRPGVDRAFSVLTGLASAVPAYVLATVLVVVFAVGLGLLPPAYSRSSPGLSFVLPVAALSLGPVSTIARVVRRETALVLEADYMRTARGWRVPPLVRYAKYALPNLLTSTLTLAGLVLTGMLGGAIIVETVFGWPGLGLGVVNAIAHKDYPLIQGTVLVLGVFAAVITLAVDVVLAVVDPRIIGASGDR
ncbi:ABC transporter permease [Microbacterium sp. No. 7]|uniref:ABC transporter permease n=1 Tax=Microbacterium sp. No. 7 TaxID=1714373 RepID=UPI0006ED238E|nr:ABC transporter permease [Microbacterium sp. No. 7]ALJ21859.1 peptide ABC transporter permease [Microbacterium sp. No. 7]